jgi:hypothetical protein
MIGWTAVNFSGTFQLEAQQHISVVICAIENNKVTTVEPLHCSSQLWNCMYIRAVAEQCQQFADMSECVMHIVCESKSLVIV